MKTTLSRYYDNPSLTATAKPQQKRLERFNMAKILSPFLSQDASGSVGILTTSRVHSGQTMRLRSRPLDHRSVYSTLIQRLNFEYCGYTWSRLSATVRQGWVSLADFTTKSAIGFGASRLTAKDIYFRLNLARLNVGYDVNDSAPLTLASSYMPLFTCYFSTPYVKLTFDITPNTYDTIIVYQKRNLRASALSPQHCTFSEFIRWGATSPYNITPAVDNGSGPGRQPPFTSGSTMHIKIHAQDDLGRTTVKQFFSVYC